MDKKYTELGFAKIDTDREKRRGGSETVFCESKTDEQLIKIFCTYKENGQNILGTRVTFHQAEILKKEFDGIEYNPKGRTVALIQKQTAKRGTVAICTGGTGDIPVAEEAASTVEFFGSFAEKYYDVGIAGIHRLFDKIEEIKKADVIIAIAGMEGALAGVITGLVDIPVIAVPTSVGYGSSMKGVCALLTMLNSCAEGMTVVNIDNGFNAGYCACQIIRKIYRG